MSADIPGKYQGQVRTRFHVLQQWTGSEWRNVPEFRPGEGGSRPAKIHFGPEDHFSDDDAVDRAFRQEPQP